MSQYVDGFVIPVPKDRLADYQRIARKAAKIWMEYGALDYRECVGDDMEIPDVVNFPKLAKAKPGEVIIFAWIVYKSKKQRDAVNAKIMQDPRIQKMATPENAPFDCKRMTYGGFKTLVKV